MQKKPFCNFTCQKKNCNIIQLLFWKVIHSEMCIFFMDIKIKWNPKNLLDHIELVFRFIYWRWAPMQYSRRIIYTTHQMKRTFGEGLSVEFHFNHPKIILLHCKNCIKNSTKNSTKLLLIRCYNHDNHNWNNNVRVRIVTQIPRAKRRLSKNNYVWGFCLSNIFGNIKDIIENRVQANGTQRLPTN